MNFEIINTNCIIGKIPITANILEQFLISNNFHIPRQSKITIKLVSGEPVVSFEFNESEIQKLRNYMSPNQSSSTNIFNSEIEKILLDQIREASEQKK